MTTPLSPLPQSPTRTRHLAEGERTLDALDRLGRQADRGLQRLAVLAHRLDAAAATPMVTAVPRLPARAVAVTAAGFALLLVL